MAETVFDDLILHDLKSPLSGITSMVEMFLSGLLGPLTEDQIKSFYLIKTSAKQISSLLMELQVIRNIESKNFEPRKESFSAEELLKEIQWLKNSAEKEGKELITDVENTLIISADKELAIRMAEDLILNGIKQSERGAKINFNIKREKNRILFEVIDSGKGVPKEYLPRVFDKSFKTDNPQLKTKIGPGLGFHFCKLVVEAQGGEIAMENLPKKGSRYYFYLPVS